MSKVLTNWSPHEQHAERSVTPCVCGLGEAPVQLVHTQPNAAPLPCHFAQALLALDQSIELSCGFKGTS